MKGCEAVAEFHGVWPGWVAVIVTLPSFQTGNGVSIGGIAPKRHHGTVVAVEGEGGES